MSKRVKLDPWIRPERVEIDPSIDSFFFQQLDIDTYNKYHNKNNRVDTIYRLYGVTENGNSVTCHVYNYIPYIYVEIDPNFKEDNVDQIKDSLNGLFEEGEEMDESAGIIPRIDYVYKESVYGYSEKGKVPFLKVYIAQEYKKGVGKVATVITHAFEKSGVLCNEYGTLHGKIYESNIDTMIKFVTDKNIVGCGWIKLPSTKYYFRSCQSSSQYEVHVQYDDICALPAEGEWSKIAPIRILSFDIECAGRKGIFPTPSIDPVIQIANVLKIVGTDKRMYSNIFTLNTCDPIPDCDVVQFPHNDINQQQQQEARMLEEWSDFISRVDPDIITGYNIQNFDLCYLSDRAAHINARRFGYFSKINNAKLKMEDARFESKAYGARESKAALLCGVIVFDMIEVIKRDYKLRSYSLNSVSSHFLNQQKEDVHHSLITGLYNGTPATRQRLGVYCVKDAKLPIMLMDKLMSFINYCEMARVTGVLFKWLLSRGQQIKVISAIKRHTNQHDYVIPVILPFKTDEQYEGATVIEPKRGYYVEPVATLDFASLYPSIMMAHNLCYTTFVKPGESIDSDKITTSPCGHKFVKASIRKGILPLILENLIGARKKAKQDLKNEKDDFKRAVLDGRQLALKISANSVYGFTGATVGKLPCLEISESVTGYGREMIEMTAKLVVEKYTIVNGYTHNARVLYGDTDSVMIVFGGTDIAKVMALGKEAAVYVSGFFTKPINLEFEKVYFPYLLINKKRYAGLYWTKPEKHDKMDVKGLVTVRRDNCPLVVQLINRCLDCLLNKRDVEAAKRAVEETVGDLLTNKVDISQLIITKQFSKSAEEYAAKQAHVELAARMKKRDEGSAPSMGDRIPYVMTANGKKAKGFECSEDPLYVIEHGCPIDYNYYIENQLKKPVIGIFEHIIGASNALKLFKGEHTRTVIQAKSTVGIMKFTVKQTTCIGCKTVSPTPICDYCKPREAELYIAEVQKLNILGQEGGRMDSQCRSCQKSLFDEIICSNRDCSIFYRKFKNKLEFKQQDDKIKTLGWF